jgi:hypothetical protein
MAAITAVALVLSGLAASVVVAAILRASLRDWCRPGYGSLWKHPSA